MDETIQAELDRVETERQVRILFACESGSRAWGFPSQDSDYDVRFVYCRPLEWYLSLERQRDVIEEPIDNLLDVSGWDLDKTLKLLRKSNPNILEWVESPIIYREAPEFAGLRGLLADSFNPRASVLHYLNMATNNKRQWLDREQIKIKKYLYTIRPLLCAEWVLKHHSQPPMVYLELLDDLHPDEPVSAAVRELVRIKVDMNELDVVPRHALLSDWIDQTIASVEQAIPERSAPPAWPAYTQVFTDTCRACFGAL